MRLVGKTEHNNGKKRNSLSGPSHQLGASVGPGGEYPKLIFNQSASIRYPTKSSFEDAKVITFNSPMKGSCIIRVKVLDNEGGLRLGLNGKSLAKPAEKGKNNQMRWYEVRADNLVKGKNKLRIWANAQDWGEVRGIKVYAKDEATLPAVTENKIQVAGIDVPKTAAWAVGGLAVAGGVYYWTNKANNK